jgi:hypothetical protein
MNLVLGFHPEAELQCITGDYEAKVPGLGARFRHEMEDACSAIVQHPLLWRLRKEGWRRVNLPGFPLLYPASSGIVISHRFRSTTDCIESVVALNRWDNALFSQILMTLGISRVHHPRGRGPSRGCCPPFPSP